MTTIPVLYDDQFQDQLNRLVSGAFGPNLSRVSITRFYQRIHHRSLAFEGVPRLAQTAITRIPGTVDFDLSHYTVSNLQFLFEDFFTRSAVPPQQHLATVMNDLLKPLFVPRLTTRGVQLRNATLVLALLVTIAHHQDYPLTDEATETLWQWMAAVVHSGTAETDQENLDDTLANALTVMTYLLTQSLPSIRDEQLETDLVLIGQYADEVNATINTVDNNFRPVRYEAAFLAQHVHTRLCSDSNTLERFSDHAVLSKDGLTVMSLIEEYRFARSTHQVSNYDDVVYFEATLLSNFCELFIGWATRCAQTGTHYLCNPYCILLETGKYPSFYPTFSYQSRLHRVDGATNQLAQPLPGDVIGCLADPVQKRFKFYLNGAMLTSGSLLTKVVQYSSQPYHAVIGLKGRSACRLNFGQVPFKYPPPQLETDTDWSDCHLISSYKISKYNFIFKQTEGHSCRMFVNDERQVRFDQLLRDLEHFVVQHCNKQKKKIDLSNLSLDKSLLSRAKILLVESGGENALRALQSTIEVIKFDQLKDQNQLVPAFDWLIRKLKFQQVSHDFLRVGKALELLLPYTTDLMVNKNDNDDEKSKALIRVRNLCLLMRSKSANVFYKLDDYQPEFVRFLIAQLTNDSSSNQCYALQAIADLCRSLTEDIARSYHRLDLKISEELVELLEYAESHQKRDLYESENDRLVHIFDLYLRFYLENAELLAGELSNEDLSNVIYSPDGLTVVARNNGLDNRPTLWSTYPIPCDYKGVIYYEVIILALSCTRIGWTATVNGFSDDEMLGHDQWSIGFSGNLMVIAHMGVETKVSVENDPKKKIQVGDVLGSAIDLSARRFHFYLNGVPLVDPAEGDGQQDNEDNDIGNVHFATNQSYRAAVTMGTSGGCYLNFGQLPFRHAPPTLQQYDSIHRVSGGNMASYRLVEPNFAG